MDLHLSGATPTHAEQSAVDEAVGALHDPDRPRRSLLLPALHAAQSRAGWISTGALEYICKRLDVPPAEAYGVATFYSMFSLTPRPPVVAHVCDDIACRAAGAEDLCEVIKSSLGPAGKANGSGRAMWLRSPCLGLCDRAPAALVTRAGDDPVHIPVAPASPEELSPAIEGAGYRPHRTVLPQTDRSPLRLLRRVGVADPESLDDYRKHGGYEALPRAMEIGAAAVIREVTESRLAGRGGAAFPTGRKWDAVAGAKELPHYLVCNADESEPGTFKDRVLMEEDPHAVIEAMTIAGFATGCERGYIYIRGEYPLAAERIEKAIGQARSAGLLGPKVMDRDFSFEIAVRRGAGAYICGEETALFNSIEGFRGEPRNKPPFPTQHGLFGRPTVVNNVETLVNVPGILLEGGQAFARVGTAASTGPRLFCLSGRVTRPGLYEVHFGTKLRDLLEMAGGVTGGRPLQAILLGGAAGTFVGPDDLDLPLTFEDTRAAGASLGSGVVMVFDDTIDLQEMSLRIASFFREESCGQCVPCRVGTVRQEELLHRLASRKTLGTPEDELRLLVEVGQVMRDASICGLGQTASSAVESAVKRLGLFNGGASR